MKTFLPIFAILLATVLPLASKTIQVGSENLSLDVPDSWTSGLLPPSAVFTAVDPQQTSSATLVVTSGAAVLTADYISGMERGMAESIKSKGGTLTVDSQTPQSLNGVPCYLIQGQIALPTGKVIHVRNYVISANDKVYGLLLETLDESTDTELLTIANSFRFLSPPQLPDPMANSLSYKIGQVTGFFIFLLAAFCTIRFFARMITRASQRK